MKQRLKLVRKKLGFTQEEFADRLGIKRSAISNYEIGRNIPIDAVLSLISREFNVNKEWLRTGEGEMFIAAPTTVLDAVAKEYNLRQKDYVLIEKLVRMSPEERDGIFRFMQDVVNGAKEFGADPDAPVFPAGTAVQAMAHLEEDERQSMRKKAADLYDEQNKAEEKPDAPASSVNESGVV